jgi:hypothetical protein
MAMAVSADHALAILQRRARFAGDGAQPVWMDPKTPNKRGDVSNWDAFLTPE